ncbi:hypothetical protein SAMN00777080_4761 [Aquiflexum balticum DSM 16537]|uniref:Acetyltransferase (GNAT) domain-containing protein n=1 Tax=Aquiflexum balticum DSM 16537 TaxID=758820 RepID=A0A1W2HBI0_9BACT|nr:hypothetical protein [Aquiflexum balticum]SMD46082.1 hypothetical protein SAMN00777080_4761 [Aquiflexum balticum DSM 16537]
MIGQLIIRAYQNDLNAAWDAVVANSVNGTFIHKRDFMEYHGDRFQECSLIFFLDEQAVAIFPAEKSSGKVFSYRGLTYAGWIMTERIQGELLSQMIGDTLQYFKINGFQSLEIRSVPDFFCLGSQVELTRVLNQSKPQLVHTGIFYATPLPFQVSDRGRKWGRKKALSQDLKVIESLDFDGFWTKVLEPHLLEKFKNKPVHSLNEISFLKDCFPENIKLFPVYLNEEMIAGTVLFIHAQVVHTQYIATNAKGRELRALDLLFDVILNRYNRDKSYLSLGTSLDARTGKSIAGLVQWKESLGAKRFEVPVFLWEF